MTTVANDDETVDNDDHLVFQISRSIRQTRATLSYIWKNEDMIGSGSFGTVIDN
jgi:hypothetical protein